MRPVPYRIESLSAVVLLRPGDLIFTGMLVDRVGPADLKVVLSARATALATHAEARIGRHHLRRSPPPSLPQETEMSKAEVRPQRLPDSPA